jgi:2-isopropylmalate synthase
VQEIVETVEYCNQLPVHPRHPYGGELVFTAFSGSHQDAIKKGFAALEKSNSGLWEVPYLPIDPKDIGRDYEAVIRVNSQSGKGGVAYLLQTDYGLDLPRRLQVEFSKVVQAMTDATGKEVTAKDIWQAFEGEYLKPGRIEFLDHKTWPAANGTAREIEATIRFDGKETKITGTGTGPIDAYVDALKKSCGVALEISDYREHAVKSGSGANAAAYVDTTVDGKPLFGVGIAPNIVTASLSAITSAANRALRK